MMFDLAINENEWISVCVHFIIPWRKLKLKSLLNILMFWSQCPVSDVGRMSTLIGCRHTLCVTQLSWMRHATPNGESSNLLVWSDIWLNIKPISKFLHRPNPSCLSYCWYSVSHSCCPYWPRHVANVYRKAHTDTSPWFFTLTPQACFIKNCNSTVLLNDHHYVEIDGGLWSCLASKQKLFVCVLQV